jgi:hypothetical protein
MIDKDRTMQLFGYDTDEVKHRSNKKIVAVCDECGEHRIIRRQDYRNLCRSCAHIGIVFTDEHCNNLSKAAMNKTRSPEHCKNISKAQKGRKVKPFTDDHRRKLSEAGYNRSPTTGDTRRKMSATRQGITYDEWESFAKDSPYCPKFNEACRESNRDKYNRRCFLCGKEETKNGKKLSVHHVDMNKQQGCNNHEWKLVPLCHACHARAHTTTWSDKLTYLLDNVYTKEMKR